MNEPEIKRSLTDWSVTILACAPDRSVIIINAWSGALSIVSNMHTVRTACG